MLSNNIVINLYDYYNNEIDDVCMSLIWLRKDYWTDLTDILHKTGWYVQE